MKQIKMRTLVILFTLIIGLTFVGRRPLERLFDRLDLLDFNTYAIEAVDDSGYRIKMKTYPERIISLHPAHTINLFHFGLEHQIVGVHKKDVIPLEAVEKPHFDPMGEAGPILKEEPDLILITPQIERDNPDMINQLRRSGSRVFSIYPENMADLERYFITLGIVTGKQNTATRYYKAFKDLESAYEAEQPVLEKTLKVYYEVSELKHLAASKGSIQDFALGLAGAELHLKKSVETYEMTTFGDYDTVAYTDEPIDWILSEEGGAESGGSAHSIEIRSGYDALEAVKKGRVKEIDFRIIGVPSIDVFRGIEDLKRILYPIHYGQIESADKTALLAREKLADWLMKERNMWTYYPDYRYFQDLDRGHYYGQYEDVPVGYPYFDAIETCVQAGYLKGRFDEDGIEWFDPQLPVTRDQFALALYLAFDLQEEEQEVLISDIDLSAHKRVVERLVGMGIIKLDPKGAFNPQNAVTEGEAIEVFEKIGALKKTEDKAHD